MSQPRCSAKRKDGEPCGSFASRDGKCAAHSDRVTVGTPEHSRRAAEASVAKRRELAKSAREVFRERVDEHVDQLWNELYAAATEAVDEKGQPDYRTRALAVKDIMAEAYGKPLQPTKEEGSGPVILMRDIPRPGDPAPEGRSHLRVVEDGNSAADTT